MSKKKMNSQFKRKLNRKKENLKKRQSWSKQRENKYALKNAMRER